MHTYDELLLYLEKLQETRIKLGLDRILAACEILGHPEKSYPSVHIAGTNGKGSTAAFMESILRNNGYKVGLFTSPHLVSVRERIQIDRELIPFEDIVRLSDIVFKKCEGVNLSFFEFLTSVAFLYFREKKIDIAVFETGLGGKWDSTNVIEPVLSIITTISVDHASILGSDPAAIAKEKCGIIKKGVPLVTVVQQPEVHQVISEMCRERGSPLVIAKPTPSPLGETCLPVRQGVGVRGRKGLNLSLKGDHQLINASLAATAAVELQKLGYKIKEINKYLQETTWPGRLQTINFDLSVRPEPVEGRDIHASTSSARTGVKIILDGAHNPEACRALVNHIKKYHKGRNVVFIFAAMKDKDIGEMVSILKEVAAAWVIYPLTNKRAAQTGVIASIAKQSSIIKRIPSPLCGVLSLSKEGEGQPARRSLGEGGGEGEIKVVESSDPRDAVTKATQLGLENPLIIATGSLYLVADFLKKFKG